jgi:hypothetical protein
MLLRTLKPLFGCLAVFGVFGVGVWGFDRSQITAWIGASDLVVQFEISDISTGRPIANARIMVRDEGSSYDGADEDRKAPFGLETNGDGVATRILRNNTRIGQVSRLRFTDSRFVYTPSWKVQVSADGYKASEWIYLPEEYSGKTESDGPGQDRLVVRLTLEKSLATGARPR